MNPSPSDLQTKLGLGQNQPVCSDLEQVWPIMSLSSLPAVEEDVKPEMATATLGVRQASGDLKDDGMGS